MRTRLLRIGALVAALVCFAVVPTSAQSGKSGPPVIIEAIVSADDATLFVGGVNYGQRC